MAEQEADVYTHIKTLAVFYSSADENWVAIEIKPDADVHFIGARDVQPWNASVSAFGDTPSDAVYELSVAMSLRDEL